VRFLKSSSKSPQVKKDIIDYYVDVAPIAEKAAACKSNYLWNNNNLASIKQ